MGPPIVNSDNNVSAYQYPNNQEGKPDISASSSNPNVEMDINTIPNLNEDVKHDKVWHYFDINDIGAAPSKQIYAQSVPPKDSYPATIKLRNNPNSVNDMNMNQMNDSHAVNNNNQMDDIYDDLQLIDLKTYLNQTNDYDQDLEIDEKTKEQIIKKGEELRKEYKDFSVTKGELLKLRVESITDQQQIDDEKIKMKQNIFDKKKENGATI